MPDSPQDPSEGQSLSIRPGSPAWLQLCQQISARKGYKICGAKNRQGRPCEARPYTREDGTSNGRCYNHGGPSKHGLVAPGFKDGRRSRYRLTGAIQAVYEEHLGDMEYISMRDDLALNTTLLQETLNGLLLPLPEPLDPALFDPEELKRRDLEIQQAVGERQALFQRYRQLTQDRVRMTRTEVARVRLAEDTVSGQQVRIFGQAVLDAVRRRILEWAGQRKIDAREAVSVLELIQADVVTAIQLSRRATGASGVPQDAPLA